MTVKPIPRRAGPLRLPTPRLLPATIVVMAALLVVKSGAIVQAYANGSPPAAPSLVPAAKAAAPSPPHPEAPAGKPAAKSETTAPAPSPAKAEAGAGAVISAKDRPQPSAVTTGAVTAVPVEPAVSESERQLLTDLRQRRLAIDQREQALAAREATFAAVDRRLAARVDELTTLQHRLERLEREHLERDEASWRGLVKLYETMKPKDAAVILNDLDLPVLLPVMDRMKEAKAATILAAMLPDRARLVTTELAQMRLKANSLDGKQAEAKAVDARLPLPATAPSPAKAAAAVPASSPGG